MKIIRFQLDQSTGYGIAQDGNVFSIEGDIFDGFSIGKCLCKMSDVRLLAPIQPRTIVGVGKNYQTFAVEADKDMSTEPQVFLKSPSSVIAHLDNIVYPKISNDVRCGGELAVVMKHRAIRVTEEEALQYVLGYTCALDVSAFDIAERDIFVTRAKSFYSFCPLGPCIETTVNVGKLGIACRQNGILKQEGSTAEMLFGIARIVRHVTEFMALEPGDLVLTGTNGSSFKVRVGDLVDVEIEDIGLLQNVVVPESYVGKHTTSAVSRERMGGRSRTSQELPRWYAKRMKT